MESICPRPTFDIQCPMTRRISQAPMREWFVMGDFLLCTPWHISPPQGGRKRNAHGHKRRKRLARRAMQGRASCAKRSASRAAQGTAAAAAVKADAPASRRRRAGRDARAETGHGEEAAGRMAAAVRLDPRLRQGAVRDRSRARRRGGRRVRAALCAER